MSGSTITIRLPDGRRVNVQADSPEEAAQAAHKFAQRTREPEESTKNTMAGLGGNFLDAMVPGLAGAVRGAREVVVNAAQAPFSDKVDFHPGQSYNAGRAFQEVRQKRANTAHPTAASAISGAGIAGSLFLPASKIARAPSLAAKAVAGAKTAAGYGALSGLLSSKSNGIGGVLSDVIGSGLASGAVGAALPYAARAAGVAAAPLRPLTAPIARMAGRGLEGIGNALPGAAGSFLAREGRQLSRDPVRATANHELDKVLRLPTPPPGVGRRPLRPAAVPAEVARRQSMGVPAVPADLDEVLAQRLASAGKQPGPAVSSVRRAIEQRQQSSGARMAQHVREALGPTANIEQQAETIRQRAQAAARPLYDDAYAAPGVSDAELAGLLSNRSGAMTAAKSQAHELALREGRDPTALGFDLAQDGQVTLNRPASWETVDLVKRGLQSTADKTRNAFGHLDNDGRTIMSMAGPLVRRAREVNPAYGQALDTYGGEIAGREALLAGRDSLRDGAEDLANLTAGMSPYEAQNFALGNRSALATDVADFSRKAPQGNAAARVQQNFGQPGSETYGAMQGIHGVDNVDRLSEVADMEDAAHGTWRALGSRSGAPEDFAGDDQRIADAARGVFAAGMGHPLAALGSMTKALATGNHQQGAVDARVASVLGEADLEALTASMREVGREKARRALVQRNGGRALQQGSRFLGGLVGTNLIAPVEEDPNY